MSRHRERAIAPGESHVVSIPRPTVPELTIETVSQEWMEPVELRANSYNPNHPAGDAHVIAVLDAVDLATDGQPAVARGSVSPPRRRGA